MKVYGKNAAYIDAIFRKDQDGHYTKDALFYQDILRYYFVINPSITTTDNRFHLLDLKRWVVENNLEINEYFQDSRSHTSLSNKMHIKGEQITRKFENMVDMHLIKMVGQETYESVKKIKVNADIYEYTDQGILISLLIKCHNRIEDIGPSVKKGNIKHSGTVDIYSAIYDTLDSILMKTVKPSYTNIFYSFLFKRCKLGSLFQKMVQQMYNILNTDNYTIRSISDLLAYTVSSTYLDVNTCKKFFRLWKQTIEDLKPEARKIVLYQMKLLAEQRFQNANAPLFKSYEKIRFKYRDNFEYIIVGGNCNKCSYYDATPLNYIEYIRSLTHSNDILKKVECKKCKAKQGILIPKF